jgi:riboflavin kinase/FMN adenylyltransferase
MAASISALSVSAGPAVIAPGNYDGVHVGHRHLLARARTLGAARQLAVRPLIFDPHPASVLAPERAPTPLTGIPRRTELLLGAGADEVWVQPFDRDYAAQSPEQFVERLLAAGAAALVVGPDFRFGRGRVGDVSQLQALCAARSCEVHVESPVLLDGVRVSSSAIRNALTAGELDLASRLLGRVHDLEGTVVQGDQRGRTLGFPTANLTAPGLLAPADGVYAVRVRVLGEPDTAPLLAGVANVGVRPTFGAGRSIEVHLFDYDGSLYGRRLRVGFVARIRAERQFESVTALKQQIGVDCESARQRLAEANEESLKWI